jgi:DNA-binding XRE family transcriptional regulator
MQQHKNRIKQSRTAVGMTQTQLAVVANVGLATLNRIERWHYRVSESTARKLARALGREVGEVFPYLAGTGARR